MQRRPRILFVGTGKSGLGHLRRMVNIARHLAVQSGDPELALMTNAVPGGLAEDDLALFSGVQVCERSAMAERIARDSWDVVVLDTVQLPGFEAHAGRAILILRETPRHRLERFRRAGGRPWDLVVVPNPASAWRPPLDPQFAVSVEHVGWIGRRTGPRCGAPSQGVVVATGGGGTPQSRAALYPLLDNVIADTRRRLDTPLTIRQALGPRADGHMLGQADEGFCPGPDLNEVFRCADLVISTAGYNSVLELAGTDTPALLVAVSRNIDDQMARVREWGPRLGFALDAQRPSEAAGWLADQIRRPRRREPVDLGPDGAREAAMRIAEVLCPAS